MALNATLIDRRDLRPCLSLWTVQPDSSEVPAFDPGQFIMMGLPSLDPVPVDSPRARRDAAAGRPTRVRMSRRSYSIASPAGAPLSAVELYLVRIDTGKLTPRLWELREGDRLHLDDKCQGQFTLSGFDSSRDLMLVATGTGLAPYVSMVRTYAARPPAERPWRRCTVVHGVRDAADLAFDHELRALADANDHLVYEPIVSRGKPPSHGRAGRIDASLACDPATCNVMLCGNPAMIDALIPPLTARGYTLQTHREPGNLRVERYW